MKFTSRKEGLNGFIVQVCTYKQTDRCLYILYVSSRLLLPRRIPVDLHSKTLLGSMIPLDDALSTYGTCTVPVRARSVGPTYTCLYCTRYSTVPGTCSYWDLHQNSSLEYVRSTYAFVVTTYLVNWVRRNNNFRCNETAG